VSINRTLWRWMMVLGGAAVLAALAWRVGVGPFVDGVTRVSGQALAPAAVITLFTTVCSAWRWRLVAHGLGVELPLRTAVAAYYRSQFLNSVLPGGVLGDVDRGVNHGLNSGDVGRGLRAVFWERVGGQVVQFALAMVLLGVLPSPVHSSMLLVAAIVAIVAVLAVVVLRARSAHGKSFWARALRTSATDVGRGLLARGAWPGVVLASSGAMAGYAAIFFIAARAAGVSVSPVQMLPLAVLVLLAMSIPANVAGWGPREGVAAWAFAAAGLGASQGVTVAVAYGVLAFASCLPGAAILGLGWLRHHRGGVRSVDSVRILQQSVVDEGSVARG
jgi:glycosyltransferase 2 family protein